jgi:hypothetical protein
MPNRSFDADTHRHLLFGAAWLIGAPLAVLSAVSVAKVQGSSATSTVASVMWALGFIVIFWSWATNDVVAHGKAKSVAWWFSAAWLLLHFLAVFPYLFVTRGFKRGVLASLQFACYLLVCGIAFLGVPPLLLRVLS